MMSASAVMLVVLAMVLVSAVGIVAAVVVGGFFDVGSTLLVVLVVCVLRNGRLSFGGNDDDFSCKGEDDFPFVVLGGEDDFGELVLKPEKVLLFCFLRSATAAASSVRLLLDGLSQEVRLNLTMIACYGVLFSTQRR